jgi:GT2 family glycosyltransferase
MKLSVVIPCRNEHKYIQECVEFIFASVLPEGIEMRVYVVDGMSDDGTRERVSDLVTKFPNLELVDNAKQLTPYAFNLGIYAGGKVDFVQIVGARHILSPDYLATCLEKIQQDASIWCVGGRIVNEYINETGRIISKAMSSSFGMGIGNFRTLESSGFTDTVTSPMYPYEVFEKIGFFDEELIRNQDDDFNFRVTQAGGKIWYEHGISLKYYVRADYKGLWRQFYQYGYWKVFVNRKHGAVTTLRQLVPPLFVVYLCAALFCLLGDGWLPVVACIPALLYVLLASMIAFQLSDRSKDILGIMRTFPILHFSYGFGYLAGMYRFLLLRKKPTDKQKRLSR